MTKDWTHKGNGIYWKQDPAYPKNSRKKLWKATAYLGTIEVYSEKKGRMITRANNTTSKTFHTEDEALNWQKEMTGDKVAGEAKAVNPASVMHFDEEYQRYWDEYSPRWEVSARNSGQSYGRRLVAYFGKKDPRKIETIDIERFYEWCRQPHEKFPQALDNNTLVKVKSYLRKMFEQWQKEPSRYGKRLSAYTVIQAKVGPVDEFEGEVWSVEQLNEAFDYVLKTEKDLSRLVLLGLGGICGMRRGEIAGLQWGDIYYDKHLIDLQRQRLQHNDGEMTVGYLKKGKPNGRSRESRKLRYVAIPESLEQILKLAYQQQTVLAGKKPTKTDYVYRIAPCVLNNYNQNPRKLSTDWSSLQARMNATRAKQEKEELPYLRLHDLRHTSISAMLNHGVDIIAVAANSGHVPKELKNLETLKTYWHMDADRSQVENFWNEAITVKIETPESNELNALITKSNRPNLRSDEIF